MQSSPSFYIMSHHSSTIHFNQTGLCNVFKRYMYSISTFPCSQNFIQLVSNHFLFMKKFLILSGWIWLWILKELNMQLFFPPPSNLQDPSSSITDQTHTPAVKAQESAPREFLWGWLLLHLPHLFSPPFHSKAKTVSDSSPCCPSRVPGIWLTFIYWAPVDCRQTWWVLDHK